MTFPKYPEYKDSGVEWLGEVPAHWQVLPLKAQFQVVGGSTPSPDEEHWGGQVTWVTPADLSSLPSLEVGASSRQITKKGLASCGATLVPSGSLVLSTRAPIGSLAIASVPLCTNQGCKSLVPANGKETRFFAYLLRNCTEALNVRGKGTTFLELSGDELSSFKVTVPPQNEQATISNFLDHETARIDALVEEQQRLIELLKEKRQAVISHAVTKGLDPDVPMKDSGVEWLGEVPAHWEVMKFVRCVDIAEGQVDPKLESHRGKILIAPNHIESATGRILYLESAEEQGAESGKYVCRPGDVIYCKIRPALRKACILGIVALCSADMYPLRPFDGITSEFLLWTILSEPFSRLAVLESERVAMPKINRESLNEIYMAIPPANEQEDIDRYISEETCRLDKLTSIAEDSVRLLAERRSALISAAVTGKIDVRDWQPPAGSSIPSELTQTETV
ncbi:restriction endonuclease subunit S [Halomonas alimentaria]|uniref:restriction endonuclease subunit S n=1 Tax=Halomonas alimentaria TaxID=147248 RepID=UPI0024922B8F|nr:restriction endonuclease subunit S [Halomonas alimentaria]